MRSKFPWRNPLKKKVLWFRLHFGVKTAYFFGHFPNIDRFRKLRFFAWVFSKSLSFFLNALIMPGNWFLRLSLSSFPLVFEFWGFFGRQKKALLKGKLISFEKFYHISLFSSICNKRNWFSETLSSGEKSLCLERKALSLGENPWVQKKIVEVL